MFPQSTEITFRDKLVLKKSLVTGHSRMFTVATESTGVSSFMLPVLWSSWQMQQNTLGHHFLIFLLLLLLNLEW